MPIQALLCSTPGSVKEPRETRYSRGVPFMKLLILPCLHLPRPKPGNNFLHSFLEQGLYQCISCCRNGTVGGGSTGVSFVAMFPILAHGSSLDHSPCRTGSYRVVVQGMAMSHLQDLMVVTQQRKVYCEQRRGENRDRRTYDGRRNFQSKMAWAAVQGNKLVLYPALQHKCPRGH